MPDRDPALEAALEVYLRQRASAIHAARAAGPFGWSVPSMEKGLQNAKAKANERLETLIESAQDAAFRSLGAGTPEAVTALRELVRAITAFDKHKTSFGRNQILFAEAAFARLATPPEEGR